MHVEALKAEKRETDTSLPQAANGFGPHPFGSQGSDPTPSVLKVQTPRGMFVDCSCLFGVGCLDCFWQPYGS